MQKQQSIERDVISVGYVTDEKGHKWRVWKPGDSRIIEGSGTQSPAKQGLLAAGVVLWITICLVAFAVGAGALCAGSSWGMLGYIPGVLTIVGYFGFTQWTVARRREE